jgi:hypothetical protein
MLGLLALAVLAEAPFDPARVDAMARMADRLRTHVVYLEVELPAERGQPLSEGTRDGFGAVWSERRVVCLSFVVADARAVRVRGPRGVTSARVILTDVERRVALLEVDVPLSTLGLGVPERAPETSRQLDAPVFALVGTAADAHVVTGHIIDDGRQPELEGHPRVSLELTLGMPLFDDRARLVGYARRVSWDKDTAMIVTPVQVEAARSATTAAARPKPPQDARPWWVR